MIQQRAGRDPFASGGSTKRLYEVGRVGFNTVVDQTLMKKHARIMHSAASTDASKTIARFKNTGGNTVPAEVSGSVVPQEPLYVCMGHNAQGANTSYDSMGRPLNNVKACHVSSSLNHLQCTTDQRVSKLTDYVVRADKLRQATSVRNFTDGALQPVPDLGAGDHPRVGEPFLSVDNRPGMRYAEDLAIYRDLAPTFVGFASGSYDAPSTLENIKKPSHLAGNCGGLMTVQATAFVSGLWGKDYAEQGEARKGIEIGEPLCVTYPREGWHNQQCGVPNQKTTLVVCSAKMAQAHHLGAFLRGGAHGGNWNDNLVARDFDLPAFHVDNRGRHHPLAGLEATGDNDNSTEHINCRIEYVYDSYMTRPLNIGQCRSGCRKEGQMMDLKYDLAAPNIQDLITFAFAYQ